MKSFKDTTGREWPVRVTIGAIARVQDDTGVDLTRIYEADRSESELLGNPSLLWRVLCSLLKPQMEAAGVTPDELGDRLQEAEAEAAGLALFNAVIDFFQGQKREVMGRAFQKLTTARTKARDGAMTLIGESLESVDFDAVVRAATDGKPTAGSSPESLALTPAT